MGLIAIFSKVWNPAFALFVGIMLPMATSASPQAATDVAPPLRIQVLNGRTGRPVTGRHLILTNKDGHPLEGNGVGKKAETTDGEGYAPIPNRDVGLDRVVVNVEEHRPCSKTAKHEFSLVKVRTTGVVSENSCRSRITLFPQPGTLIFFIREETFLERMRH